MLGVGKLVKIYTNAHNIHTPTHTDNHYIFIYIYNIKTHIYTYIHIYIYISLSTWKILKRHRSRKETADLRCIVRVRPEVGRLNSSTSCVGVGGDDGV